MGEKVQSMQETVSWHLGEIAKCFKNPKITIVIRAPQLADGDVVMTDDDPTLAIAAIQRLYPKVQP